ncbi:MAG: methyltransferase [Deltaproteobacteria bacterium]|nr:methyltransferase [Deltaproteobacteria bacterium]
MPSTLSGNIELRPGESIDEFMEGRLRLIQSKTGYRFSVDAVLLSEFVTIRKGDCLIDIGTGCGIIPLLLLLTKPVGFALGLEIQPNLADQAARNARLNGLQGRMEVVLGDLRAPPLKGGIANVVTCNPPYRPRRSGRLNPDMERAIARHEIRASMDDIINMSRAVLRDKGRLAMIYPAARLADLMVRMRISGLEPKRMKVIYPGANSEAKLVLIEALKGGRPGLKILSPVIG